MFLFFFSLLSTFRLYVYSTYTHGPSAAFLLSPPLLLSHIRLRCNVKEMKKKCEESGKEGRERPLRGKGEENRVKSGITRVSFYSEATASQQEWKKYSSKTGTFSIFLTEWVCSGYFLLSAFSLLLSFVLNR